MGFCQTQVKVVAYQNERTPNHVKYVKFTWLKLNCWAVAAGNKAKWHAPYTKSNCSQDDFVAFTTPCIRQSPVILRHSIYTVHVHLYMYCEKCSCTNSTSSIKVILVWHYDQNDKMYMYAVSTLGVCRVWSDTVTPKHPPPGLVHAQYAFPGANTVVYSLAAQKAKCNWCDKKRMTSLW